MTRIWQQINEHILIVQQVLAQFLQRCVAKLACCQSWVIHKDRLLNAENIESITLRSNLEGWVNNEPFPDGGVSSDLHFS